MNVNFNLSLGYDSYMRHKNEIAKLYGENTMSNITEGDSVKINYKIDLPNHSEIVEKLWCLFEIAEDRTNVFKFDMDEQAVKEFAEIGRLLLDLKYLAEANSHRELCNSME